MTWCCVNETRSKMKQNELWVFEGSRTLKSYFRSGRVNKTLDEKESGNDCCQRSLQKESLSFMKGVMDECTHMANFSGEFCFDGRTQRFSSDTPVIDSNMTPNYRSDEMNEGSGKSKTRNATQMIFDLQRYLGVAPPQQWQTKLVFLKPPFYAVNTCTLSS